MNQFLTYLLIVFVLLGCKEETFSTTDELSSTAPTNLLLDISLIGEETKPHGDGSGVAAFTATAIGASKFDFRIDDGAAIESVSGEHTNTFTKEGTHTYKVTAIAYSKDNSSDSIAKNIRVHVGAPTIIIAPKKYGMTQVWADEFEYNGAVDPSKWHHQIIPIIGNSWANNEVQHYTNEVENSFVSHGTLKIVAKKENYHFKGITKEYTSARLNSKYVFKYGRVDISARLPATGGTWPAFWTLGANINEVGNYHGDTYGNVSWPNCGEIDIMEQNGWNKNHLIGHLHWGNTQTNAYENKGGTKVVANTATTFNLYSLVWNEENIKILFNDEVVFETENTASMPYDNPHYILFNIAMGGTLGGNIPANFTQATMEVDYIRIYQ